jgi:glycosyltransferase involved in cell wall biosynthesis
MIRDARLQVLHVGKFYPPHMGGMETHLKYLCDELSKEVDVEVLVANTGASTVREEHEGVDVTRAGTAFTLAGAPVCPRMLARIRQSRADIVHLHLPNPAAALAYLASGHEGRLIVTYHSDIVRQKVLGRAFQPILRRLLDRCASIVVSSPNLIDSSPVLSEYRERCRVVPFGIPLRQFQEVEPSAVARIRAELGPRLVLAVGRMIYYKGFEHLIDAMRTVDARLLLVGDGPMRRELERQAAAAGVADRVTFLGRVASVAPYYHAADVFVLPSVARSEAFGLVQAEAMACGTPVINTRLDSGVPFVSLHGETGLTVPPADAGALATAIRRMLEDPARRERYAAAARVRAETEFSLEAMLSRTMRLYEEVVGRPAGGLTADGPGAGRARERPAYSVAARPGRQARG